MRVLITGASKGIGRATAIELAARGHEVVATARRAEDLANLKVAERIPLDVTNDVSVAGAIGQAGEVDVLVNNAGVIALGPVEAVPVARVAELFDVNVLGCLRMIGALVPAMRERGSGRVVNVSSVVGRVTMPLNGVYGATKYAIEALSEALAFELGPFGVDVAVIEPGAVASGALDTPEVHDTVDRAYQALFAQVAFNDPMETATVAAAIADVVERDSGPLRVPVGAAAEGLLGARASMDDASLDAMLRSALGLDWTAEAIQ